MRSEAVQAAIAEQEAEVSLECTLCGQGPLYRVEIIPDELGIYILCAECERMWRPEEACDPSRAIDFISFMNSRGHEPLWENVRKLKRIRPEVRNS
jgi:hypothetical protein